MHCPAYGEIEDRVCLMRRVHARMKGAPEYCLGCSSYEGEGDSDMGKRGTCVGCGRGEMSIVAKGLCGRCYARQRQGQPLVDPPVDAEDVRDQEAVEPIREQTEAAVHVLELDFEQEVPVLESLRLQAADNYRTPVHEAMARLKSSLRAEGVL